MITIKYSPRRSGKTEALINLAQDIMYDPGKNIIWYAPFGPERTEWLKEQFKDYAAKIEIVEVFPESIGEEDVFIDDVDKLELETFLQIFEKNLYFSETDYFLSATKSEEKNWVYYLAKFHEAELLNEWFEIE